MIHSSLRVLFTILLVGMGVLFADTPGMQYNIGDHAQGGIIFWLTPDRQHGLAAATSDLNSSLPWCPLNATQKFTGAKGLDLGVAVDPSGSILTPGKINTDLIIAAYGNSDQNYAAYQCHQYTDGMYSDWYLPSLGELGAMLSSNVLINGNIYWSSSENLILIPASGLAHALYLLSSSFEGVDFETSTFNVRPVRAF